MGHAGQKNGLFWDSPKSVFFVLVFVFFHQNDGIDGNLHQRHYKKGRKDSDASAL